MDPDSDPDPPIFVIDLQETNKKLPGNFLNKFFAYYFLKVHLHHFSKIKIEKEVTRE
jgi:hypothetical protein